MSTMSGLHLEQLQEVVEQQRAEIERLWLRLRLKVPDRDKLLAEIERLRSEGCAPGQCKYGKEILAEKDAEIEARKTAAEKVYLEQATEIARLTAEVALWKDRYEAAVRDHELTIKHANELSNEVGALMPELAVIRRVMFGTKE